MRTQSRGTRVGRLIGLALAGLMASCLCAAEHSGPPAPDAIPRLPVTTGWLGNSLLRGGQADWKDKSQTYLQLYTSDMAVTGDGRIYCTTTWEEGARAAGIYKDGDALEDIPGFGLDSGSSVAVTEKLLAYGRKGRIGVFTRAKDGSHEVASGREITFDATPDAPNVTGVCLDEAKDIVYAGDASGVIRSFQFSSGKAINAAGFAAPRVGQMRLDADGNIWALQTLGEATYTRIAATAFGSEPKEGHEVQNALPAKDGKAFFEARDDAGFVGLDLGQATAVHYVRFHGAGDTTTFVGAKLQGSTTGPDGPWTDIVKIEYEPRGWPETAIALDGTAWRALRIAGSRMGVRGLGAFTRQAVAPGAVIKFSPTGERLAVISEVTNPLAIALDPARDRLLVFDNSPAQQIVAFTGLAGTPRIDTSFGDGGRFGKKGGLSGAQGRLGDQLFDQVRGLGVDARENLIVFNVGGSGMSQSRLESYASEGKLNWRMVGMAFLDSADVDPGAPEEAWSCTAVYRRDPASTDGDGWRLLGTSLDTTRFPDDPRANGGGAQTLGVRRIGGQRFLFTTTQGGNPVSVFRFDETNGFNGIPCAYLSGLHSGREWPPHQPPGGGLTLWRDGSGDGQFQAGEFTKVSDLTMSPITVHAAGNLWYLLDNKGIVVLDAGSLDGHGVPAYSFATARRFAWPAGFAGEKGSLRRIVVAPDGRALVAFGFTKEWPSVIGHNHPLGRLAVRYAIEGTTLRETHRIALPYDVNLQNAPGDQGYVATGAGDYIFVGYEQRMTVLVYKAATLELVGRIDIGPQSQTPIFDGPPELIVSQRGAAYELFMPQYTGNATTVVTWKPIDKTWLPAPTDLRATRVEKSVELSWKPTTDAVSWQIERRILEPTGWSAWKPTGVLKTSLNPWRDPAPPDRACAYRLRALGADQSASDWSKTSYLR